MPSSQLLRLFLGMGPNTYILVALFLVLSVVIWRAVSRMRVAEPVRPVPVLLALTLPLLLAVLASTVQLNVAVDRVVAADNPLVKQTLLAMAISRAIGSQLFGGLLASGAALALMLGCAWAASPGERPRLQLAGAAAALTWVMVVVLMASGTVTPSWTQAHPALLTGARGAVYLGAGLMVTLALLSSHKRGPGASGGLLAAVSMPLVVAGGDAALLGYVSADALWRAAQAPPSEKMGIIESASGAAEAMSWFSWAHLLLAVGLAALGLLATRTVSADDVPGRRIALALAAVIGVFTVSTGSLWMGWLL